MFAIFGETSTNDSFLIVGLLMIEQTVLPCVCAEQHLPAQHEEERLVCVECSEIRLAAAAGRVK
jgi:hypothetical protein